MWHMAGPKSASTPTRTRVLDRVWLVRALVEHRGRLAAVESAWRCQRSVVSQRRDEAGAFYVARARWYPHVSNTLSAEALAVRDGARLATDWGLDRVLIECVS